MCERIKQKIFQLACAKIFLKAFLNMGGISWPLVLHTTICIEHIDVRRPLFLKAPPLVA